MASTKLANPAVTIGKKTILFPTEIESGSYLELNGPSDCKLYGPKGELIRQVTPQGEIPLLQRGQNEVKFRADMPAGVSARARVTVISAGEPFGGPAT